MVIPVDAGQRGHRQPRRLPDDENQGAAPGAASGLSPLGYPADARTERETVRFYVDLADRYAR
jgi:hypothetical protein